MDAVAFLKKVNEEFGADISPAESAGFSTLRELINRLEG
ncbi:MAG: hypothetical protein OXM02_13105 [Bacteroidota bacterium]|nr:hypothetical protein [Bacteroidota bacterium]MDE2835438.1 hypothetical protein [Bacteroidota bacterium]MDE2955798.1 hypothetical protein [Bacteroidota bacterium]